jgi:hypothetical protein
LGKLADTSLDKLLSLAETMEELSDVNSGGISFSDSSSASMRKQVPHALLHTWTCVNADDTFDYTRKMQALSSPIMSALACQLIRYQQSTYWGSLLVTVGKPLGTLYTRAFLTVLSAGTYKDCSESDKFSSVKGICRFFTETSLKTLLNPQKSSRPVDIENKVLTPIPLNWPTWDAAVISGTALSLFQCTISTPVAHGIQAEGLDAIAEFAGSKRCHKIDFYWVLPLFTVEEEKDKGKEKRRGKEIEKAIKVPDLTELSVTHPWLSKMKQHVLVFDIEQTWGKDRDYLSESIQSALSLITDDTTSYENFSSKTAVKRKRSIGSVGGAGSGDEKASGPPTAKTRRRERS